MKSDLFALSAIALWSILAALGVSLSHVPPFLLTGIALLTGNLIALPLSSFRLSAGDLVQIAILGLGPLGGAFFLWDAALKTGDPRRIGVFTFLTPLLSTFVIAFATEQPLSANILFAAAMIIAAAAWGHRATRM